MYAKLLHHKHLSFLSCAVPSGRPERHAGVLLLTAHLPRGGLKEACHYVSLSHHRNMHIRIHAWPFYLKTLHV